MTSIRDHALEYTNSDKATLLAVGPSLCDEDSSRRQSLLRGLQPSDKILVIHDLVVLPVIPHIQNVTTPPHQCGPLWIGVDISA